MRWSDRFGPFRLVRKAHPSFQPNNGMRLPNGVGCGNCIPEYWPGTGRTFRTGAQKETVSRFGAGAAENWPVIWFGLEYALTVDVGRCGHGDR